MRAARTAVTEGLLKRKENGVYALTKQGRKSIA